MVITEYARTIGGGAAAPRLADEFAMRLVGGIKTGGNAWESNPPPTPQPARDNDFEDRERHQPLSASAVAV